MLEHVLHKDPSILLNRSKVQSWLCVLYNYWYCNKKMNRHPLGTETRISKNKKHVRLEIKTFYGKTWIKSNMFYAISFRWIRLNRCKSKMSAKDWIHVRGMLSKFWRLFEIEEVSLMNASIHSAVTFHPDTSANWHLPQQCRFTWDGS